MCFQVLSNTHDISKSFDSNPSVDVTEIFLDLSKVFDKVCHYDLFLKLQVHDIGGHLLKLLRKYLKNRQQRGVLNEQTSSW